MAPFSPSTLPLTPSSEFNADTCHAIQKILQQNETSIQELATPPSPLSTRYLSHHIKVNHHDINYIDVLYDQKNHHYALLIKKREHQHHEGFFKKVCTQFLLTFDNETPTQTTTAVVSIKAKDDYHEDIVTHETAEEDGLVFTCVSSNKSDAKRINKKRAIQVDLGPPLASQLEAIAQLDKPAALSTVCGFMVQVGTQIAYYNLIKRKTHFDLHTGNILCKTQPLSETQNTENFTVIDYPNNHLTCQGGVDTEPSKLFYYDDLNQKIDVGYGVATPIIAPWPDMFGWNELETLLKFLDLDEATIKKFNNIALTGEGEKYKIHGFTADSFGYLRGLYTLMKDSKELTVLFKPFLKQQLLDLLQTSHSMPQQLPKHLTSLGLLQNFITYCTTHSELNNHISTQLALPATTGWQENTKTLLSTSIDTPNTKPITTRTNQKPSSSETFQHYINTLSQESTQLASQYFLDTKTMPIEQKITDLCTFMEQISEQITAYHTQHNTTHFHILTSQITTHLADEPDGGKVRKFTLLPPSYLNQVNAPHLAPEALYDYDAVHKKADQQWGMSSPFITPWPDMKGWDEYKDLLLFINVNKEDAKKYGDIALTNEGDSYQTSGYMIDSYGYLYSLYSLIKDDRKLSQLFQPFLQKQMLDVITTSHKRPTNWPESLKAHNIMEQFKKYCQSYQQPLQKTKKLISQDVKINKSTMLYDFTAWLFTGRKTTLSLKMQLLNQLTQLQTQKFTPKAREIYSLACLQTLQKLVQRCPNLPILAQAHLDNLHIQLISKIETQLAVSPSHSKITAAKATINTISSDAHKEATDNISKHTSYDEENKSQPKKPRAKS